MLCERAALAVGVLFLVVGGCAATSLLPKQLVPERDPSLNIFVAASESQQLSLSDWQSRCQGLPRNTTFLRVHMGDYVDFFKPVEGATMCDMLTSNNKHLWTPNPAVFEWQAPAYSTAALLGGSAEGWPVPNVQDETRSVLAVWGTASTNPDELGGCCHAVRNDTPAWGRPFTIFYDFVVGE